jgi:hypothetical protein
MYVTTRKVQQFPYHISSGVITLDNHLVDAPEIEF